MLCLVNIENFTEQFKICNINAVAVGTVTMPTILLHVPDVPESAILAAARLLAHEVALLEIIIQTSVVRTPVELNPRRTVIRSLDAPRLRVEVRQTLCD